MMMFFYYIYASDWFSDTSSTSQYSDDVRTIQLLPQDLEESYWKRTKANFYEFSSNDQQIILINAAMQHEVRFILSRVRFIEGDTIGDLLDILPHLADNILIQFWSDWKILDQYFVYASAKFKRRILKKAYQEGEDQFIENYRSDYEDWIALCKRQAESLESPLARIDAKELVEKAFGKGSRKKKRQAERNTCLDGFRKVGKR